MRLEEARFCVVDVETTGLDIRKDEIVAFACIPVENLRIIVRDACYLLLRPEKYKIQAMKYHGISDHDLFHARTFKEEAERILSTLDGILVGHSVHFDYALLKRHLKKCGLRMKRDQVDIALIERWLRERKGEPAGDLSLDAIISAYGLKEHYRHNAYADAFFTAQIFQLESLALQEAGVETTEDLFKLLRSCKYPYNEHIF